MIVTTIFNTLGSINILLSDSDVGNARVIIEAVLLIETITPIVFVLL